MNIIDKISVGNCSVDELEKLLDEKNPIILYHVMTAISKFGITNENIMKKLYILSFKREAEDKLLGYYKVGDLAIVTLQKIGENIEEISSYQILDDFDRKVLKQLAKEIGC